MYRVLITDDEPIAAESVSFMIRRNFPELNVIGISRSGRDAIDKSYRLHPDIVIMDINMQGINGLDAIRQIKESSPDISIVVISAYDYFDYAVEALKLGTQEYLLKPVKESTFTQAMKKVISRIKDKHESRNKDLEQLERLDTVIPMLESGFVEAICSTTDNLPQLLRFTHFFDCTFCGGYVLAIQDGATPKNIDGRTFEEYRDILKSLGSCIVSLIDTNRVIAYFYDGTDMQKQSHKSSALNRVRSVMSRIRKISPTTFIGIGRYYDNIAQSKISYAEALSSLAALSHFTSDLKYKSKGTSVLNYDDIPSDLLKNLELGPKHPVSNVIIARANEYLDKHYREDISLKDISDSVNLSPYYFSRYYKEEVGIGFTEKLTLLRIEKAKELLVLEGLPIGEVSYMVGFSDPNYFSKLFKKTTGMTPSEYRLLSNHEEALL